MRLNTYLVGAYLALCIKDTAALRGVQVDQSASRRQTRGQATFHSPAMIEHVIEEKATEVNITGWAVEDIARLSLEEFSRMDGQTSNRVRIVNRGSSSDEVCMEWYLTIFSRMATGVDGLGLFEDVEGGRLRLACTQEPDKLTALGRIVGLALSKGVPPGFRFDQPTLEAIRAVSLGNESPTWLAVRAFLDGLEFFVGRNILQSAEVEDLPSMA